MSARRAGVFLGGLVLVANAACQPHLVEVELIPEGHSFSLAERRAIQKTADEAARDVRALLPMLPSPLQLVVQPGKGVIAETGETATAVLPASIYWTVDPHRDVRALAERELRPTLFHELHHLARDARVPRTTLMDNVVTEGLATAFERDFGHVSPPWGVPPPEVAAWVRELMLQPDTASRETWLSRHPDGRRWIGLRAGTYLVDRAMRASGRTAADLVKEPTEKILRLANAP